MSSHSHFPSTIHIHTPLASHPTHLARPQRGTFLVRHSLNGRPRTQKIGLRPFTRLSQTYCRSSLSPRSTNERNQMGCASSASASGAPRFLSTRFLGLTNPDDFFLIKVDRGVRLPSMDIGKESDPYVRVMKTNGKLVAESPTIANSADPVWNFIVDMTARFASLDDDVVFEVWDRDRLKSDKIGFARISIRDLIKRPATTLLLNKPGVSGDFVINKKREYLPAELHVSVVRLPKSYPQPKLSPFAASADQSAGGLDNAEEDAAHENEEMKRFAKHVMIITRGTRGDVQPYLALARGLANSRNYCVTIVTELRYKDFVLKNTLDLTAGAIRFRPAGGDTTSRIDKPIARWALANESELMQMAMLSRSEREFFASEPVIFYWAKKLRPNALVYGFTMCSIAMIISEALKIPCVGFILQPTTIPSQYYAPLAAIDSHFLSFIDRVENKVATHDYNLWLKRMWEDDPIYRPLTRMRQRRGLKPLKASNKSETFTMLLEQNGQLVVPINPTAFGGRPKDWPSCVVMTDFIFLQGGATPKLSKEILDFIEAAHAAGDPVIAMTFSSMPVGRADILNSTFRIVNEAKSHPRVIALSGAKVKEKLTPLLTKQLEEVRARGKVLELEGAPFGLLFEKLDATIIHGGLGTTAESMRAGIPTSVCGVLLMDQRFWGNQCEKLGVGAPMCHIASFKKRCVEMVDAMLSPDSPMKRAAKELATKIQPTSPDGVPENVEAICRAIDISKPIDTTAYLASTASAASISRYDSRTTSASGTGAEIKAKKSKISFFSKKPSKQTNTSGTTTTAGGSSVVDHARSSTGALVDGPGEGRPPAASDFRSSLASVASKDEDAVTISDTMLGAASPSMTELGPPASPQINKEESRTEPPVVVESLPAIESGTTAEPAAAAEETSQDHQEVTKEEEKETPASPAVVEIVSQTEPAAEEKPKKKKTPPPSPEVVSDSAPESTVVSIELIGSGASEEDDEEDKVTLTAPPRPMLAEQVTGSKRGAKSLRISTRLLAGLLGGGGGLKEEDLSSIQSTKESVGGGPEETTTTTSASGKRPVGFLPNDDGEEVLI